MTYPNLFPFLPELFMAFMIIVILMVDAFCGSKKGGITFLTLLTFAGCFGLQMLVDLGVTQYTFNNMFILDSLATGTKLFIYVLSFITVIYIKRYLRDKNILIGEFYAIFLFAVLGMMVMISADNMLILYVGLELLSLALYGLIALQRDSVKATESAMKFFILGALASGILLYGISFVYGGSGGQLQLESIAQAMTHSPNDPLILFGLVFIVAGLAFKLGLVPFHMWVPDVYEGSPLAVGAIIGSLTKIAAVVFIIRFLIIGLPAAKDYWSLMLLLLAVLSLFFGNIIAVVQTNVKRILGYSTVSHMGFVALGFVTMSVDGLVSSLFYVITYSLTTLAAFGVLTLLSKEGFECETLDDLKGLAKTQPGYAFLMLLIMFSMAGIPPLVGFYAKFNIIVSLIAQKLVGVSVFAVLMSLIGAFFYIRVVKVMYFDDPVKEIKPAEVCAMTKGVLLVNVALLLVIGIFPTQIMMFCRQLLS